MYKDESIRARKNERIEDSITKDITNLFRLKKKIKQSNKE